MKSPSHCLSEFSISLEGPDGAAAGGEAGGFAGGATGGAAGRATGMAGCTSGGTVLGRFVGIGNGGGLAGVDDGLYSSGFHWPGAGVIEMGFEPSEDCVLGGLAHTALNLISKMLYWGKLCWNVYQNI